MAAAPGDGAKIRVIVEKPDGVETFKVLETTYGAIKQNHYDKDVCKWFPPKGPPLSGGCKIKIQIDSVAAFTLDYDSTSNVLHMDTLAKGRGGGKAYLHTFNYNDGIGAADVVCIPGEFVTIWEKTIEQGMIRRAGYKGPEGTGRIQMTLMST
jgi:hypothetical protein